MAAGLLLVAVLGSAHAPPTAAAVPPDQAIFAQRVLELTNAERGKVGLAPLALNPQLVQAAQAYSEVLATSACFQHTCGPVPELTQRVEQAGYTSWRAVGENLAAGYPTPEAVFNGWMSSPGHRHNILSPGYTEVGIGLAAGRGQYGTYWAEEFGQRAAAPSVEVSAAALDAHPDGN